MGASVCRSCGKPIVWLKTIKGHNMPTDPGAEAARRKAADEPFQKNAPGLVSHFDTCPNADKHRKK